MVSFQPCSLTVLGLCRQATIGHHPPTHQSTSQKMVALSQKQIQIHYKYKYICNNAKLSGASLENGHHPVTNRFQIQIKIHGGSHQWDNDILIYDPIVHSYFLLVQMVCNVFSGSDICSGWTHLKVCNQAQSGSFPNPQSNSFNPCIIYPHQPTLPCKYKYK